MLQVEARLLSRITRQRQSVILLHLIRSRDHADIHDKGPVMAEGLGEPASKEDLKKRAEELNK